jgi:hypothetical protein
MNNDISSDDLVKNCDYNTKLAVTAWVFRHIVNNAYDGGSFRYLIYDRLGFNENAYVPLYMAGGMDITNEFNMELKQNIIKRVKENKIEEMKNLLGMCDEPECFELSSCGTSTDTGYRTTCQKHIPPKRKNND